MPRLNLPWVVDPKSREASVSLTNFVLSVLFLLIAGGLYLGGLTKDTSLAVEYFGLSASLYWGRKFTTNKKSKTMGSLINTDTLKESNKDSLSEPKKENE